MPLSSALADPSDTTPAPFVFIDQTDVALSTPIISNQVTISGIDSASPISVTGGEYSLNGATYTTVAGTVPYPGPTAARISTVKVRHTSSASNSTSVDTVLIIGGVSDTFTSTTVVAEPAPTPVLTTITVSPTTPSIVIGANQQFTATGLDQFSVPFATTPTWTSDNLAVATIDPVTGLATGVTAGTATITATDGSVFGTTTLTVTAIPDADPAPTLISYTVSETIISPNGDGIKDSASIDISYSEEVSADINILNSEGVKVRDLYSSPEVTNPNAKVWDGKNNSDAVVPDGIYTIEILGTDSADNTVRDVSKTVTVDTTAPVISLLGITPVNLTVDDSYTDAGATALDDVDGDITSNIVTINSVNTAIVGAYTITYNVSDTAGNPAIEVTRTVNVNVADEPPADFDEMITIDAGEWALISAPRLLSEAPSIDGEAALLVYRNGAFVIPSIGDDELVNPLSAFYVKTTNEGDVGFNFADGGFPASRQLTEGWNLVGTSYTGAPINVFSTIVRTNDPNNEGVATLNVPIDYNNNKDTGGEWEGISGDIDLSRWDTDDVGVLNPYDGYWVYSNAVKTYSLVPQPE